MRLPCRSRPSAWRQGAVAETLQEGLGVRGGEHGRPDVIDEGKGGRGHGARRLCATLLGVATGQSVGDHVETARPVFNLEVEAEELADPLVLGNSRHALVQQKLETVVISAYQKVAAP